MRGVLLRGFALLSALLALGALTASAPPDGAARLWHALACLPCVRVLPAVAGKDPARHLRLCAAAGTLLAALALCIPALAAFLLLLRLSFAHTARPARAGSSA